ncbi:hypothetical protein HY949_04350 [Candidatus Gottesmanbacteria bacterium]|nr:hypothetical protein [Candidatus Gottesmanbacteria bacterium]
MDSLKEKISQPPEVSVQDKKMMRMVVIAVYAVLILLGLMTGYLLSRKTGSTQEVSSQSPKMVKTDKMEGVTDTKSFKDSTEGIIEKGGINGEGTHKILREGGPSQTAYLVSSVIDLDAYVGKKVKVWGETFAAKKASWLMDVGKIEILE